MSRIALASSYTVLMVAGAFALGFAAINATHETALDSRLAFYAIALCVMTALAHCVPINLSASSKVFADTAAVFAAVLLLPAPLAILTVGGGIAAGEAIRGLDPLQFAFNVSEAAVEVAAAALLYFALVPDRFGSGATAEIHVVAMCAAAFTIYALNVVLVDIMVAIWTGFGSIVWSLRRHSLDAPQQVALYIIGAIMAITAYSLPLSLPLLAVPAVVVYISLRDGHYVRRKAQETLETLADTIDYRDRYTFEHSQRVADLSRDVAIEMGLSPEEISAIYMGARIHDVGKIGIRGQVLLKEGPLDTDEWCEMRTHPEVGAALASRFPDYTSAAKLVLCHHERFDGGGYPNGLKGKAIPLGARVIAVADSFDAMTSRRSYRNPIGLARTLEELRTNAGTQFDPACVTALLAVVERRGVQEVMERAGPALRLAGQPIS